MKESMSSKILEYNLNQPIIIIFLSHSTSQAFLFFDSFLKAMIKSILPEFAVSVCQPKLALKAAAFYINVRCQAIFCACQSVKTQSSSDCKTPLSFFFTSGQITGRLLLISRAHLACDVCVCNKRWGLKWLILVPWILGEVAWKPQKNKEKQKKVRFLKDYASSITFAEHFFFIKLYSLSGELVSF